MTLLFKTQLYGTLYKQDIEVPWSFAGCLFLTFIAYILLTPGFYQQEGTVSWGNTWGSVGPSQKNGSIYFE